MLPNIGDLCGAGKYIVRHSFCVTLTYFDAFAKQRGALSRMSRAGAGKAGASGDSEGGVHEFGLLRQKLSENRRKVVRRTATVRITFGYSGWALADTYHAYRCPPMP